MVSVARHPADCFRFSPVSAAKLDWFIRLPGQGFHGLYKPPLKPLGIEVQSVNSAPICNPVFSAISPPSVLACTEL
jgi:hypothetical protein